MRCKNCGADNDDSRYICEVCGSPLYDENDIAEQEQDMPPTEELDKYNSTITPVNNTNNDDDDDKKTEKKSVIVIAILVVVLIAIIASVVAVAHNKRNNNDPSAQELTRASITMESTEEEKTTEEKTTEEETTEKTTKQKTTKTTTKAQLWIINTSSSGGGEAEGDGKYKNGDTVTLIARPDDGYQFDGWYSSGMLVSADTKFVFSASENASFTAVFSEIPTEDNTQPINNDDDSNDDNGGFEVVDGDLE